MAANSLAYSDRIKIPATVRELPINEYPSSVRLIHALTSAGFHKFGDLDGWPLFAFRKFRQCGWKTVADLRKLVRRIQAGARTGRLAEFRDPKAVEIAIPAAAQLANLSELALSARLENVL